MYGTDVERILTGINKVKDTTISSINSLSNSMAYRINSDASHAGMGSGPCKPLESSVTISASNLVIPIRQSMNDIKDDYEKMNKLADGLYISINEFNNSYGSPWTELNKLENTIALAESFMSNNPSLDYIGDKAGLLGLLNLIVSTSIDAKWALIYYHDYIQRGYDNQFNNNDPTIKFTTGINNQSIGNIKHKYTENVHIKEPSIDPF